jgi:acyl-CoA synthetase (AMP-forming)/AMP-acid ligase II
MGRYSPNITANYLGALARHNGDGDAILVGPRRVTWGELAARAFRIASALIRRGVRPGDKVALMFHNTPEFIEVNFAAQVAGAVPTPLNYRFTAAEAEHQLRHSDAVALFFHPRWSTAAEGALGSLGADGPRIVVGPDHADYEAFVAGGDEADPRVTTAWDDVAVMVYTGGTTGPPKGVMLSYGAHLEMFASLLARILSRGAQLDLSEQQLRRVVTTMPVPGLTYLMPLTRSQMARSVFAHPRTARILRQALRQLLSRPEIARVGYRFPIKYMTPSMPFFHDASYQMLMLGIMAGNLTFLLSDRDRPSFDPEDVLEAIERERPFFVANVPTGWNKLVASPAMGERDLSSVVIAATGAGVCPAALKRAIMERIPGVIIIDMLGQTEMTPITSFRIDASPETLKDRSVGETIVETRIVDERGEELPAGQTGEIWYHTAAQGMKGYYKDREGTADVTRDGWLRSGDLGYIDEEAELRIVDRLRECINTGGEKVFPTEVEEVLGRHPAVEQACVIGVPDEEWGEAVRAVVQLRDGREASSDELSDHCRDSLAGFKVPRSVVFVDEIPRSPAGKVMRSRIREIHGN